MNQQSFFQAWNHLELTPDARRTFDAQRADRAKQTGIDDATSRDPELFARAKRIAVEIAQSRPDGCCHADLVAEVLARDGLVLGNAAGGVFRQKCWEFTGGWVTSRRVSNHAHKNRIWRYVGV